MHYQSELPQDCNQLLPEIVLRRNYFTHRRMLILGFVLGEMLEQNLRRALTISNGSVGILWQNGVAITRLILARVVIVMPLVLRLMRKRRQRKAVVAAS